MMLEFLGWPEESGMLKQSIKSALEANATTPDLGGTKRTLEIEEFLLNFVSK
jgi:tartrate dehydrogenase/decarboxylase/D-malate dehydrogenase